ncbi:MAG: hypothetical protein U9N42_08180 [Campylobacterota bacterium]|nr:hypothetical protein [Campylobacterota bacterium]
MKKSSNKIVSFLKGASWAYITLGSLVIFSIFSFSGLLNALFLSISFLFFSLFILLILDFLEKQEQKFEEIKKQTELLKEIRDLLK